MAVRLKEGNKPLVGGDGIEITDNNVINLKLRSEDNLIKINEDHEAYVDLQLEEGISTTDELPVGVTTGRVLVADGRPVAGTITISKTTSGDYTAYLFGDDGKVYVDNGTGTFKQIYLKSEVDAIIAQLRGELATVAYTGDYDDLINKPTLGTAASKNVGTNPGEIPIIGSNGKLPGNIIPAVGLMNIYTVTNLADLTTLSQAVQGDIGIVTSENKTYILSAEPYSTLSNWTELLFPTGGVTSVNGQIGAVTLTTNDIPTSNDKLYVSSTEKETWDNKLGSGNVATVALSGDYNDLINKPIVDSVLNTNSTNAIQNGVVATTIQNIQSDISDIQGDITTIQGDVTNIEGDITTIQGDITALQAAVAGGISDAAFSSAWDGDTTHAPSKNAIYDVLGDVETLLANL